MTDAEKNQITRKGNEAYNKGNFEQAAQLYKISVYKPGLKRIADYFYYEKHQPLRAYGYYRLAEQKQMLDKLFEGFVFALGCWVKDDDKTSANKSNSKPPSDKKILELSNLIKEKIIFF